MILRAKTKTGNFQHLVNRKGEAICVFCRGPLDHHERCKRCMILLHPPRFVQVSESGIKYGEKSSQRSGICTYCAGRKPLDE